MKEFTEKEAVRKTLSLWKWLAKTGETKRAWPGAYTLGDYDCFLCDYVIHVHGDIGKGCHSCPLLSFWGDNPPLSGIACEQTNSPYVLWRNSELFTNRKKAASVVVNGLEKWLKDHKEAA